MRRNTTCLAGTIAILVGGMFADTSRATTIAYWSFNNDLGVSSLSSMIEHDANIGTGQLFQQRSVMDVDGAPGTEYTPSSGPAFTAGQAIAWEEVIGAGEDYAEMLMSFSTMGMRKISIGFDVLGNSDPGVFVADVDYDLLALVDITDPAGGTDPIKAFASAGTNRHDNLPIGATSTTYSRVTISLADVQELNDQTVVSLRLRDFGFGGAMSIDNVEITGRPLPEPNSLALLSMGCFCYLNRNRRQQGTCKN